MTCDVKWSCLIKKFIISNWNGASEWENEWGADVGDWFMTVGYFSLLLKMAIRFNSHAFVEFFLVILHISFVHLFTLNHHLAVTTYRISSRISFVTFWHLIRCISPLSWFIVYLKCAVFLQNIFQWCQQNSNFSWELMDR